MSRYFFHLEGALSAPDAMGVELTGVAAAKAHAVQVMAESLNHDSQRFWDSEIYTVTATDHQGLVLFVLDLSALMSPALSRTPAQA